MKIVILARKRYCTRVLEIISSGKDMTVEHTDAKEFDKSEVAVFEVTGEESEIIMLETMIKGEFLTGDVTTYRFITGRYYWNKGHVLTKRTTMLED